MDGPEALGPLVVDALGGIGAEVVRLRRERGWRQRDLATRAGVSQSTISRLERGRLPYLTLQRYARVWAALAGL